MLKQIDKDRINEIINDFLKIHHQDDINNGSKNFNDGTFLKLSPSPFDFDEKFDESFVLFKMLLNFSFENKGKNKIIKVMNIFNDGNYNSTNLMLKGIVHDF